MHDAQGNIVEAAVIARDISERKQHEDRQRKQAVELIDAVVQGLATAKLAFEMGDHERGVGPLTSCLETAKGIVARLLDDASLQPGDRTKSTVPNGGA